MGCTGTGCDELYEVTASHIQATGEYGVNLDCTLKAGVHTVTFGAGAVISFSGHTEDYYDYVKILDGEGNELANMTGTELSWSGVAGALTRCSHATMTRRNTKRFNSHNAFHNMSAARVRS